jgi:hypothetical protein
LAIDAGSSLIANHIVQGSLVIGGSAGSPSTVTIAPSDSNGDPVSGLAVAAANTQTAVGTAMLSNGSVSTATSNAATLTPGPMATKDSTTGDSPGGITTGSTGVAASSNGASIAELPTAATTSSAMPIGAETTAASQPAPLPTLDDLDSIESTNERSNSISANDRQLALDAIFADRGSTNVTDIDSLLDLISAGVKRDAADKLASDLASGMI